MGTTQKQTRIRGTLASQKKQKHQAGKLVTGNDVATLTSGEALDPSISSENQEKENPEQLARQVMFFRHSKACASSRKLRLEDLMQREVVRTWAATKKAQMTRRLVAAQQQLEQANAAMEELTQRLTRLMATLKQGSAPFVPPPATSVEQ